MLELTKIVGHPVDVCRELENCFVWKTHTFGVKSVMSIETVFPLECLIFLKELEEIKIMKK